MITINKIKLGRYIAIQVIRIHKLYPIYRFKKIIIGNIGKKKYRNNKFTLTR